MSGIIELETLLQSMSPELQADEFVFCTVKNSLSAVVPLQPIATFMEQEGLTVTKLSLSKVVFISGSTRVMYACLPWSVKCGSTAALDTASTNFVIATKSSLLTL